MNEWVSDCCLTPISLQEQVNFQWNDDEVCFVPDQHAELDLYCASLPKQQSAGWHVAPLTHYYDSEPTSLSSYSLMLRALRWGNKYKFIVFGLTWSVIEPTIYHTLGEHANHYTTDAVSLKCNVLCCLLLV
jgi:hypothetical protein